RVPRSRRLVAIRELLFPISKASSKRYAREIGLPPAQPGFSFLSRRCHKRLSQTLSSSTPQVPGTGPIPRRGHGTHKTPSTKTETSAEWPPPHLPGLPPRKAPLG